MVSILESEYTTHFYRFSIDSDSDLELLPKYGVRGKEILNTVSSCCPGSIARCTDGSVYVLNGDLNKWVKLSSNNGGNTGGNSGDGDNDPFNDHEFATKDDMDNIFGV